ncbi:VWA domain-containing protein [Leucobacter sp. USCH14]|uniref:vWA domain-containing protein n=1 Tax=Leucobacter sp. USCH14 TaxID=3024838 RepID=UPI0030B58EB5
MAENRDSSRAQLRARLEAAGAIIGISVRVTDDDTWELTDAELRVGLGWYGARGHSDAEAVALALLHLWEGPRNAAVEPARTRRRNSFERVRPDAAPLFEAVHRVQSVFELLAAMPGLRTPLAAAMRRSVPDDVTAWPRRLQWVAVVLRAGIAGASDADGIAIGAVPDVQSAWRELLGPSASDVGLGLFRRVMAPDANRSAVHRFERAVAWLLDVYDRLAARDALDRGLDGGLGGGGSASDDAAPQTEMSSRAEHPNGADADADGRDGNDQGADEDPQAPDEAEASGEADDDRVRAGDGRETAEGADLFAAEQAGFMDRVLATPMPGGGLSDFRGRMPERANDESPQPDSSDPPRRIQGSSGGASGGVADTELAEYRRRAAELADAIERMRAVWERVITDRTAPRRVASARPRSEGDDLAAESLAEAVAESLAGVPRPRAFRERALKMRRTRRSGSTDYVLLVDRSASMQGAAAEAAADTMLIMTEALAGVARDIDAAERATGSSLDLDIRTALIVFDSAVELVKPLSSGLDDSVRRAVHGAIRAPRGSTNDGAALRAAAAQLGVSGVESTAGQHGPAGADVGVERRRIVILVSDGGSDDPVAAEHALRRLRHAGVEVHGVGIGPGDLESRYAPQGRTVLDVRTLPDVLQALVLDDVRDRIR